MKTKLRGLTITALLLSASPLSLAEDGTSSMVGDLPGFGSEATLAEPATYVGTMPHADLPADRDSGVAHQYIGSDLQPYAPVGISDLRQVDFHGGMGVGGCDNGCCDVGCDSGCDSACGASRRMGRIGQLLGMDDSTWASAEALLWFVQDRDMPALITTSDPGTAPVLPGFGAANPNNVATVFGDDIDGELSLGFRGDIGKWVTDRVGIGGRAWWINDNTDSYYAQGDGTDMSIGRPFFNTNTDTEDAVLVATSPAPGFAGEVAGQSSLEMWAAELYTRVRFQCSKNCRLEWLGGYSHFDIEDSLLISSTSIQTNPATGTTTRLTDLFNNKNEFNGGQVGFELFVSRGRWTARSMTKVHLGNMNQQVRIFGDSSVVTPPGAPANTSGGLLAMGNQGEFERDVFAFAPEANFKLSYCVRPNVVATVGYTFIYFDNVSLVGDVLDRDVDGTAIATGVFATRPAFDFDDSSLFVQGLDLGLSIGY